MGAFFFFLLDQQFECPLVAAAFPPSHKSTLQLSNNVGFWALRCSELMKHGKFEGGGWEKLIKLVPEIKG